MSRIELYLLSIGAGTFDKFLVLHHEVKEKN
jgi:hypothetical protein